jgi:hypothetical protein
MKLAGREHKSSYLRRRQRRSFGDAVADAVIFGEYDPTPLADLEKPIFVFGIGSKVVVVNFDNLADCSQRLSDDLPAERAVNEKN